MTSKVAQNAAWIIGCKVVKAVLAFVVTMLTARYLGPEKYGTINYAASLVTFAGSIMYLGLNSTLVYEFSSDQEHEGEILGTALVMCLLSSLLCILGIITFSFVANHGERETILVCILYSLMLVFQAMELTQYWFQYKLISKFVSLSMTASYFVVAAVQIFLLLSKKSIYLFSVSYALDFFLIALFLIVLYKRKGGAPLHFSLERAEKLFLRSRYYILSSLMVVIFTNTDKVMLKLMLGSEPTGYYSAAVTCTNSLAFIFAAIMASYQPVIFESRKASVEKFEHYMTQLYSVIIYLSFIISIGIFTFSPLIVKLMYGTSYAPSVPALRITIWYTTFSYIGSTRDIWMLANGKEQLIWKLNLLGALANIVLNLILIPVYGIQGAAIASLCTQVFTNVVLGFIIKDIKRNNEVLIKSLDIRILLRLLMRTTS